MFLHGGRALNGTACRKTSNSNQTPNAVELSMAVSPWGLSSTGREGKNPDLQLRSLNRCSVLKAVSRLKQPGGWLRSSHPLKKA